MPKELSYEIGRWNAFVSWMFGIFGLYGNVTSKVAVNFEISRLLPDRLESQYNRVNSHSSDR